MNRINKILLKKRKKFAPSEKIHNIKKEYSRAKNKQTIRGYLCQTD